jgi:hypothetical protein
MQSVCSFKSVVIVKIRNCEWCLMQPGLKACKITLKQTRQVGLMPYCSQKHVFQHLLAWLHTTIPLVLPNRVRRIDRSFYCSLVNDSIVLIKINGVTDIQVWLYFVQNTYRMWANRILSWNSSCLAVIGQPARKSFSCSSHDVSLQYSVQLH